MPRGLANEQPTAHQVAVPHDQAEAARRLIHHQPTEHHHDLLAALGLDDPPHEQT